MLYVWRSVGRWLRLTGLVVWMIFGLCSTVLAKTERYDLVYIWDTDLENVLDYKQELENLFEADIVKRLKIVGRGNEYGVIFDTNGSARNVIKEMARQGEILRKAGLAEAYGIKDEGYSQLYNVCYGLGPNLDMLKEKYQKLYSYLGEELGKRLFIEKTGYSNYMLIYRMRADKTAATELAKKHEKLLKRKKIHTSITAENNNDVVYGESSHLDDFDEVVTPGKKQRLKTPVPLGTVAKVKKNSPIDVGEIEVPREKKKETKVSTNQNAQMEKNVARLLQELHQKGILKGDERSGWAVYDLENDVNLVEINANDLFEAASMIKPFVGLAFFHQAKAGKLTYDDKARRMMEAMIQRSDNMATNWIMKQVGGPQQCEQILRQNYGHIFHKTIIAEYIPPGGKTYLNSALPSDYIRFLKALWGRELPYGKEIRRVMALPGHDRLYHGTTIPHGTLVYNKTGSTSRLCGDMGILVPKTKKGERFPYAIVGIIERGSNASDYGSWMRTRGNIIREVSSLVYEEMKAKHSLL
jgi:beta-lactamase class A